MSTRMVALGDSIYAGVSGSGGWVSSSERIPDMIASRLGWSCDNEAISGAKLAGTGEIDFPQVIQRLNFKNYDVCLMEFGVNDFDWGTPSTDDLKQALNKGVVKIRSDNPKIQLYYQLPTATWKHVSSLSQKNDQGWSQTDMAEALASECNALGISYYEWTDPIITYANTAETQGDTIHPNPATMVKIVDRLANWLGNNASGFIGMYVSNIQAIYNRVQKIHQSVHTFYMDEGQQLNLNISAPPNANKLNRSVYRWTIDSIQQLQAVMDQVVGLFVEYGVTDDTDGIKLWLPKRLSLDEIYYQKLKNNFDMCNKALDELVEHLKVFTRGGIESGS